MNQENKNTLKEMGLEFYNLANNQCNKLDGIIQDYEKNNIRDNCYTPRIHTLNHLAELWEAFAKARILALELSKIVK